MGDTLLNKYSLDRFNYLLRLENPNKVGWDEVLKKWFPPIEPGFDHNQIAIGLDMNTNKYVKLFLKNEGRIKHPWLTNEEATILLDSSLKYFENILDKQLGNYKISNKKRIGAIGLLYRGDAKNLFNKDGDLWKSLIMGSNLDFFNNITKFYSKILPLRADANTNYVNSPEFIDKPWGKKVFLRPYGEWYTGGDILLQGGAHKILNPHKAKIYVDENGVPVDNGIIDSGDFILIGDYNESTLLPEVVIYPRDNNK